MAVLLAVGCGPDGSADRPDDGGHVTSTDGSSTTVGVAPDPPDVTNAIPPTNVVAALGYPRDLLDRGRVNIRIDRADDVELVLLDKQLVARHFTPAPPETRRTVVPTSGQVVAVQTLFGEVSDCDDPSQVEAELVVAYRLGDDPTTHRGVIEVDDATTLDDIRLQICTQRRVAANNAFELQADDVDGETMSARLVVRRREGTERLAFDAIKGSVLFGATADVPAGSPERVLDTDEGEKAIAITFTVNRCDPHAVAETTRKYGLDLYVAVDDIPAQRIPVPVDAIVPLLDEMLERCTARLGR
jgi:hypothetical protein